MNKDGHKKQRFDIYFPDTNIGIEYQGIQHFKISDYFQGEKGFLKIRMLDERKYNLSLENNCNIIYFTYKKTDVPKDYPFKVFTNEEELIKEINNITKWLVV